ncbi:MAG TPA: ThiF family adenylyltransferase [Acidimicrobiales bacterium]|nr:ThiF family adenylyltransferase [Acidimicrobiales bacterium]
MERISSRHDGDLDGKIRAGNQASPVVVSIEIPEKVAGIAAVQHTAWMLINMLSRLENVVSEISVTCPESIKTHSRNVVPSAPDSSLFVEALRQGVSAIGVTTVRLDFKGTHHEIHLVLGPGSPAKGSMQVFGEGWCGGVSRSTKIDRTKPSDLPIGPYLAAALAAGEVFKVARLRSEDYPAPAAVFYSAWTQQPSSTFDSDGPSDVSRVDLRSTLVGVGAVGGALLQALWSTLGLTGSVQLVDNDPEGLGLTNLNRYVLFGTGDIGKPKASTAALLLQDSGIQWAAFDGPIEMFDGEAMRVICAVDTNRSRLAVQVRWPESLLMASTNELRAEVVRCDPRAGGPCAACYNRDRGDVPDDDLRQIFLGWTQEQKRTLVESLDVDLDEAIEWSLNGKCGTSGERVRDALRTSADRQHSFAVPFVSVAAGTMLAAEVIKEELNRSVPLNTEFQRATLQFFRPEQSLGAKRYLRDPRCNVCSPDSIGRTVWLARCEESNRPSNGGQQR